MDFVAWLRNKTVKMWLEIGLAVMLALFLGIAGAKLSGGDAAQSKPKTAVRTEEKNRSAKQTSKTDTKKSEVKEKEETREVIADGQYPIMGKSSVSIEDMTDYFRQRQ